MKVSCCLLGLLICLGIGIRVNAVAPSYAVSQGYAGSTYQQQLLAVQPTGNLAADLINIALSQVGYHEGTQYLDHGGADWAGFENFTEYGYFMACNREPWCASFVSWCARQARIGMQAIGNSTLANAYRFGQSPRLPSDYSPKAGDLIYFHDTEDWSHVGIVIAVSDRRVYTVEGNKHNAVRLYSYALSDSYIRAYGVWTEQGCDASSLQFENIYTFLTDLNGGSGSMSTVCGSETEPMRLYENKLDYDHDTGEELAFAYLYRPDYTFAGYYVQREADGMWLTEQGFVPAEQLLQEDLERSILQAGTALLLDESWSDEYLPIFTCYAVWRSQATGELCGDAGAYLAQEDASGWLNPFSDVTEGSVYYEEIRQAVQCGLIYGVSPTSFLPDTPLTRAQAVSLLYRMAGEPRMLLATTTFTDVPMGSWYLPALAWAVENGIVQGTGAGHFSPNSLVSGYQLLAMLHRMDDSPEPEALSALAVPDWVLQAVSWAEESQLLFDEAFCTDAPLSRRTCAALLVHAQDA